MIPLERMEFPFPLESFFEAQKDYFLQIPDENSLKFQYF